MTGDAQIDLVDVERAQLFALLGRLLAAPPEQDLLRRLAALAGNPNPVGQAIQALAAAAGATDPVSVEREHFDLFIGVGRGELLPYASYYLTGFLHERPLAELRGDLGRLGVARGEGVAEPEDHIAFLCETLAGLIAGRFGDPAAAGPFFQRHLRPWAGRFFADLEGAAPARFYRAVGGLGRLAVEIEQAAAELPP
ncbi:TorD/DmsD family molecular chaperone [Paracraurococcus ruber]|uniref:Molecular chaperone TorD n=1 Tax=Paracraurococcus ruber TaxID=77675 RepID=A0ABS1CS23_9PROT|nr:molecular chaperone TorD family protein [Paracraurococcus ruber]MBK1657252.1 molecular chaperone TorD [Paracraurococcus ruber]TDG32373.1 molecular chaperone TorD [Paracraurococcus ruber]